MTHINHGHLVDFAVTKVNLPHTKAQEHRNQVNGLRDRLKRKIDADPDYGLVKSLHAGSVAKRTALRSVNDLDLAVYVKKAEAPDGDAGDDQKLVAWLADRLFEATTNMDRSQFEEQQHCVTVNYRGSGLNVDVVPVLYEGDENDLGYLINKTTGDRMLTSVSQHLSFIRARRTTHGDALLELTRLTKWWKRQVGTRLGEFKFKSFMLELIWAHLADNNLVDLTDYPKALEQFFGWLIRTELEDLLWFNDFHTGAAPARGTAPIEMLDPVNADNNVASRYTDSDRRTIVDEAQAAFDAITEARFATTKGRAVDCWQTVLGPTFKP